ncbi:MAG: MFS transporter [Deltaproteobacteria bacterium]|nr:MFS transporter [Deltaproteobacteria bacterium]
MAAVKNRWLIAASGVGLHLSIGSVYAWSVFAKPLVKGYGWSLAEVQFTFSLAILFLGLSAALFGGLVEKHGPRRSGLAAATFFGLGLAGSGLALYLHNLSLLYLSYGVLGGIGLGVGYIAPVSTLVKWFPDRRGLATGLAIMGFGFASLLASPVIQRLIVAVGPPLTFVCLAVIYFVVMLASSWYLAPPPAGWSPGRPVKLPAAPSLAEEATGYTARQALGSARFYYLWLVLYINVTCGIAIISVASPMAQELAGLTPLAAAAMVGLIGLFNGGGRLAWASLSDYIGRSNTYAAFFVLQIVAFFLLPRTADAWLFQGLLFLAMTCYGGGFSCIPAYIGDLFGTRHLAAIHGYILTAWAAAGLTGPLFTAWVRERTGNYSATLTTFIVLFAVALVVSLLLRRDQARAGRPAAPAPAPRPAELAPDALLPYLQTFPAEPESLAPATLFVRQHAQRAALPDDKIFRLELVLEEAVTNIAGHAYAEELAVNALNYPYHHPGEFSLAVESGPTAFTITLIDQGQAFNPLTVPAPDLESGLEERQAANLGTHLLKSFSDDLIYERQGGANVLRLITRR